MLIHLPSLLKSRLEPVLGRAILACAAVLVMIGLAGWAPSLALAAPEDAETAAVSTNDSADAAGAPAEPATTAAQIALLSTEEIKQRYQAAVTDLRSELKTIAESGLRFQAESVDESEHWREKWSGAVAESKQDIETLRITALELFQRQDKPSDAVIDLALRASLADFEDERYEVALQIVERANSLRTTERTQTVLANLQLLTNRFAEAKTYLDEHYNQVKTLDPIGQELYSDIDLLDESFSVEQTLREQEAAADDLPRVELMTNKGKIVLELFENEAPETVANFISLLERGYYNGVIFHHVKPRFVAQGGGFGVANVGNQMRVMPRGVPYMIYDEYKKTNARRHFRGSLSMAHQNTPNSGSCQFFLCLAPQPLLDGRHTVFGRVIEGLTAMADLEVTTTEDDKGKDQPIETAIPSVILDTKVIRKRDHDYQPNTVGAAAVKSDSNKRTAAAKQGG